MPAQSDVRRNTHLDVAPRRIVFEIGILSQLVSSGEVWSSPLGACHTRLPRIVTKKMSSMSTWRSAIRSNRVCMRPANSWYASSRDNVLQNFNDLLLWCQRIAHDGSLLSNRFGSAARLVYLFSARWHASTIPEIFWLRVRGYRYSSLSRRTTGAASVMLSGNFVVRVRGPR